MQAVLTIEKEYPQEQTTEQITSGQLKFYQTQNRKLNRCEG